MINQNVWFLVLGLYLRRPESEPGWQLGPRVLMTREHVRQPGSELLSSTQSSKVPAIVIGTEQRELRSVGGEELVMFEIGS